MSVPSAPLRVSTPLGWRVADAYLVIALALALELLAVGVAKHAQLAGAYELGLAAVTLIPLAIAAALPIALLSAIGIELVRTAHRPLSRVGLASLVAAFAGVVAFGVSGGRHLAGSTRPAFVVAVALLAGATAWALGAWGSRAIATKPRAVVAAAAASFALLEVCNVVVLPRLYPAFHLGLGVLALVAVGFVSLIADGWRAARPNGALVRAALALVVFAGATAVSPRAASRLSLADNVRLVYLDNAPTLSRAVQLAARIAPPPPLEVDDLPELRDLGRTLDISGRDIVLITIDALRADHLGAYGYERDTSPNIDALAKEGVVFERAYTPTPHTSYALTSLMTGKYMRPLLLQGLGADSETWAADLRRYGYKTAAFYPPAVFFIDTDRFASFRDSGLDFEYRREQFASASERVDEVRAYLDKTVKGEDLFLWVHLFEPHEPYVAHPEYGFGERDVDRYDAEIRAADEGVGRIVKLVRERRPEAVIIVSADHGEEFGDHGGRYHGTTVYEEQARVPLIIVAPGKVAPGRVSPPVQLVDLLPTVLSGLAIPRPARVRGNDLGPWLTGKEPVEPRGFAFAETDDQTLLARGDDRLLCARKIGACALYDLAKDPTEHHDVASDRPGVVADLRRELRSIEASHGRYELRGLRDEGRGWPEALRRGIAGDGDAAPEIGALLDDADVAIRRKSAEVLFELGRGEPAAQLRLALVRDEDEDVRRWSALALTRLGEGAPLTREMLGSSDLGWRRLAALVLAEQGDKRGEDTLIAWWREAFPSKDALKKGKKPVSIPFEREREIARALAKLRSKYAVVPLIDGLDDVRLRPHLAKALADIGQDAARPALASRLAEERSQTTRIALVDALVALGAGPELRLPLIRFLGTPDPLPNGLFYATKAELLDLVGGPRDKDNARLRRFATSGVTLGVYVPKSREHAKDAQSQAELRVICRARSTDGRAGEIRIGAAVPRYYKQRSRDSAVPSHAPELDGERALSLAVPADSATHEVFARVPPEVGARAGSYANLVLYATQNVEVSTCALVPLAAELPPPAPAPWRAAEALDGAGSP